MKHEMELLRRPRRHRAIEAVHLRPREGILAPDHAPHALRPARRKSESDVAADIVADDIDFFVDVQVIQEGDHISGHCGFAEVRGGCWAGGACAAVGGGYAAVALGCEEGDDVSELVGGLGETVDEEDCAEGFGCGRGVEVGDAEGRGGVGERDGCEEVFDEHGCWVVEGCGIVVSIDVYPSIQQANVSWCFICWRGLSSRIDNLAHPQRH